MNRKLGQGASLFLAVMLIAAVTLVAAPAQVAQAAGTTWYVDDTGGDDVGHACSTEGEPCATIDGAIGKATTNGDTIIVAAGTYTGTNTINKANLKISLSASAIVDSASSCFEVTADGTGATLSGGVCKPVTDGIVVSGAANDLVFKGMEIDGTSTSTGSGIKIAAAVVNLQIVNNYIHAMGGTGDGLLYTSAGLVTGVHDVQGNLFQSNGGYGVNNAHATANYNVEYNSWGVATPTVGNRAVNNATKADFDPWTYVALSMVNTGSPVPDMVAAGQQITYTVKIDANNVYGADFDLNFDSTRLNVISFVNGGTFAQEGDCKLTQTTGVLSFCGSRTETGVLTTVSAARVFTVTFEGKTGVITAPELLDLILDPADDQFAMSPPSGGSTNIYASALADGHVDMYPIFTVTGRIDLQGRADDNGALMTFGVGANQKYGTFGYDAANYWGAISRASIVYDTYGITVSMPGYLAVTSGSSRSGSVSTGHTVLNTLTLLGGDANDNGSITVADASLIGGEYGGAGTIGHDGGDINADGIVDLLDLVLVGGNYGATSNTAYSSWTPITP